MGQLDQEDLNLEHHLHRKDLAYLRSRLDLERRLDPVRLEYHIYLVFRADLVDLMDLGQ